LNERLIGRCSFGVQSDAQGSFRRGDVLAHVYRRDAPAKAGDLFVASGVSSTSGVLTNKTDIVTRLRARGEPGDPTPVEIDQAIADRWPLQPANYEGARTVSWVNPRAEEIAAPGQPPMRSAISAGQWAQPGTVQITTNGLSVLQGSSDGMAAVYPACVFWEPLEPN
jgi:hypothetical protein